MRISVVIPTYARLKQLGEVIDHILQSTTDGFDDIEVVVVDDGSPESPETMLAGKGFAWPFRYRCLHQSNAGPSAARNNGFRAAKNEVVLFVDDDVLITASALSGHWKGHRDRPGSVIFGLYPYAVPDVETPAYRYLDRLESEARQEVAGDSDEKYIPAKIVASGNLSVEKSTFVGQDGVYDETLKTPMAEEIELALRLERCGTPIFYVPTLNGIHTQPTTISGKCIQDYKYGLGVAEAYCRLRDTAPAGQFAFTMQVNGPVRSGDGFRLRSSKLIKSVLASRLARSAMLGSIQFLERSMPVSEAMLFSAYRKAVGVHYFAGIREGLGRFCKLQDRS